MLKDGLLKPSYDEEKTASFGFFLFLKGRAVKGYEVDCKKMFWERTLNKFSNPLRALSSWRTVFRAQGRVWIIN